MKYLYSKPLLILGILLLAINSIHSQNERAIWAKTTGQNSEKGNVLSKKTILLKAAYYRLDITGLKAKLKNVPLRSEKGISNILINFPNSEGIIESYRIKEAPVFTADFQEKHPDMRSYVGQNTNDPSVKIRFSVTLIGLHAMIMKPGTIEFIDPITYGGNHYSVYTKQNLKNLDGPFICHFKDELIEAKEGLAKTNAAINANDGIIRTYDLALASTVEYSTFHINAAGLSGGTITQKKNAVRAAMMVTINRVNGIFERDLSITFNMINNTDIIFLAEDDGYTNGDAGEMLLENQTIIDNAIGSASYDVGHVFGTGYDGAAIPGTTCDAGQKAKGATALNEPVGDIFDVEFVAHELGHQFGASHTWSSDNGSCSQSSQWSANSSYEPGSASTIMGYAGLCAPENVQSNGDDYFHRRSIQQIWANVINDNCDTETSNTTNLNAPTAEAGANYTIPISTPYKLTGSSSDLDGIGTHTYTWEQYDLAPSHGFISSETSVSGPIVRSRPGTTSPIRYIPKLRDLAITNGSTDWEKLSSVARTINYQLTVRDNGSGGDFGQTASDGMSINVVNTAGPFNVTSQNTSGISYPVGSTQTVTWNVAGTNSGSVNTNTVNIRLSVDGGNSYPYFLLSTANDGSQNVNLPPGIAAPYCRFMVEANPSENIFFAINETNFAIGYTITENCNTYSGGTNLPLTIPDNGSSFVTSSIFVSETTPITDINVGVNVTHEYQGDLQIAILSPESTQINLYTPGNCSTGNLIVKFDDDALPLNCNNTTSNDIYQPVDALSAFDGENPSGNWTLGVVDLASVDIGVLNSWYIELCTKTITLSNSDIIGLEDLKVFPNPNNGFFNIHLQNIQSDKIDVKVFDIRGRHIMNKSFGVSGDLREEIDLNNAPSGLYILYLTDGESRTTRKIVVE